MKRSGFRHFVAFSDWLQEQACRQDDVGGFARAAAADPKWPRKRTTLQAFTSYVHERDGNSRAEANLEAAWSEYETATGAVEFRDRRGRR